MIVLWTTRQLNKEHSLAGLFRRAETPVLRACDDYAVRLKTLIAAKEQQMCYRVDRNGGPHEQTYFRQRAAS